MPPDGFVERIAHQLDSFRLGDWLITKLKIPIFRKPASSMAPNKVVTGGQGAHILDKCQWLGDGPEEQITGDGCQGESSRDEAGPE